MSILINVGGVNYPYPSSGESDTAQKQIAFAQAVAAQANKGSSMVAFSAVTAPASPVTTPVFLKPLGSNATATSVEVKFRVPFACVISKLYIGASGGPVGDSLTLTLRRNGVNTALTCVLPVATTQASDLTHSVTFAAGDEMSFSCVAGALISAGAPNVWATMKMTEVYL
jgi:hypothetical protein